VTDPPDTTRAVLTDEKKKKKKKVGNTKGGIRGSSRNFGTRPCSGPRVRQSQFFTGRPQRERGGGEAKGLQRMEKKNSDQLPRVLKPFPHVGGRHRAR